MGFKPTVFEVAPFRLAAMIKDGAAAAKELVVYVEGDGRGVVRGRVAADPTPRTAMGFELAVQDPAPTVLYLARIGQFQTGQTGAAYKSFWSNKRLSGEAVEAAGRAVDQAKARLNSEKIHLIGYSGGGGLAVLLAERRRDVLTLTTVAGLLDIDWWVREKRFMPLAGSLNPAAQAVRLAHIPQIHFYGVEDAVIPPGMSAHFRTRAAFSNYRRVAVETDHWNKWPLLWPELLRQYVLPQRSGAAPAD
ncbi:MAG: alpha/beta hydrolase [Candidatus Adiutrix sp.]|nr:alpha/beta hydrolase [Candidatus Adiutrix sp.]